MLLVLTLNVNISYANIYWHYFMGFLMRQKEHLGLVYIYVPGMQMINYILNSCAQNQESRQWNKYPFQGLSFVVRSYLPD